MLFSLLQQKEKGTYHTYGRKETTKTKNIHLEQGFDQKAPLVPTPGVLVLKNSPPKSKTNSKIQKESGEPT